MTHLLGKRRPSAGRPARGQAGFSLIEVLIAGAIITVGLLAVLGMFGSALAATQSSQYDEIAHARATQALESVYTARQTAQLGWDSINNTGTITNGTAGIFTTGLVTLTDPGPDGLDGTSDDVSAAPIVLPGPDGKLGTSDDQTISLSNFKRQIQISLATDPTTGALIPTLKQVIVTIQYPGTNGNLRTYVVQSLISQYR
jgi:prepilin-type N-terminal cleavage/methylation domain-containing protein